jgi:hypothetical protein
MEIKGVGFILSLIIILGLTFFAVKLFCPEIKEDFSQNHCFISVEKKTVQGYSLRGLVEDGQTIIALMGYYNCHDIERGDLVLYSYAGSSDPLLKIVKGIPETDSL